MSDPRSRIASLDALRGVGVLGILVVNVQSFAFVSAARSNPTVQGDLDGANWWVWLGTHLLADGKFLAVFAMLFGASIVLMATRAEGDGRSPAPLHYRRLAALFVLGLLHAYLVWYGDWLVTLAVCGSLAFLYREESSWRLIGWGLAVYAVGSVIPAVIGLSRPWWAPETLEAMAASWAPSPGAIAWEVDRYRSGWLAQMEARVPSAFRYETSVLAVRTLWQIMGLMLGGMGLFKLGVLGAERSPTFYARLAAMGFGVGVPLVLVGVSANFRRQWEPHWVMAVGSQFNYWAGIPVALGWIGLVLLLIRRRWPLRAMRAVGRLALSNYLFQSVVCTTIFYGHGLGLFASVERTGQLAIVAGVWAVQVVASVWLTRYFTSGPVEWAWRAVTYGRPTPPRHGRVR